MSQFKQQLRQARHRQLLIYVGFAGLLLLGILIVISVVLLSRATRIQVSPAAAATTAQIELREGIALLAGDTLYSLSSQPVVAAVAEGFTQRVATLAASDFGKVFQLTLEPLPATLLLNSGLDDGQASWLINGTQTATSDQLQIELSAGDYAIKLVHPHYLEYKERFALQRGEVLEKTIELTPLQRNIEIKSIPAGAQVFINSEPLNTTPMTQTLTGGFHAIEIRLDNYEPLSETLEVHRDSNKLERNYRLELKKATAKLSLQPADGQLTVDGIVANATDSIRLKASVSHKLTYSKPGYFSQTKTVNLKTDETPLLKFALQEEIGRLEIISNPPAIITINGKSYGNTPLQPALPALPQTIRFSRSGYRTVSRTVTPSADKDISLVVTLIPESAARLAQAPSTYTHPVGLKFKLFRPNGTFTMGAPRSEPGQRINEFLKTVNLSRPFYAGLHEVSIRSYQQFDNTRTGNPDMPVTSINWFDAAAYCNWLSTQENLQSFYSVRNGRVIAVNENADGYRLLTEAEWEWLARVAGKENQSRFVWGNNTVIPKNAANIADESARGSVKNYVPDYNDAAPTVAAIGQFAEEASGLYDQAGNVSEWTHDAYSIVPPPAGKVFENPVLSSTSGLHVIKGANWRSGSLTEIRPAFREGLESARDDVGFRVGRYVYGGD